MDRQQHWEDDLVRREEFEDEAWRIMTLVARDIYTTPGSSVDRMTKVLASRGVPIGPRSDEWRRYFPERPSA